MPSYQPTKLMKNRLSIYVAFALFAFTVYVIVNLFKTSVKEHDRYAAMANDNQFTSTTLEAARGSIYDCNGVTLAQSATVYNIIICPNAITSLDSDQMSDDEKERQIKVCARIISEETGCEESKITGAFENKETRNKKWFKCASRVDKQVLTNITTRAAEEELAGNLIFSNEDTKRVYLMHDLAASVIGFTNYDGDGVYGVEAYYNDYLAGVDGKIISATDGLGNQMPYKNDKNFAAQNGNSLYLTIDSTLQYFVERELQKCVEENNVDNRACGIILNAKTGAVLAMATYPGFDLNDRNSIYAPKDRAALAAFAEEYGDGEEYEEEYAKYREKQWKNKAITEIYEPGSVFKVITGSAALEEKVVSLSSTFSCGGQIVVVQGEPPMKCWTSGDHGTQDFTTAMTNSCNPAFIQIGQRLGIDKFSEYVRGYGFYEPTGIDLPGETAGIVYRAEDMGKVELASCSFGQSNTITPIQMITGYAAVINGGYLLKPYVVEKIVDPNGNVVKVSERTVRRQVISSETSAQMRQVLESVVTNKGGSNAYIKGYRIGGKSGTSEKLKKNSTAGESRYYVSSYVGFAPANDPEIIMLVMVDEPQGRDRNGSHVYYGSMVAAPVVSAVLKDALPYLGYYPEYTDEELQALDVNVPNVEGQDVDVAVNTIENLEFQVHTVGSGGQVVKQVPSSASSIPRGGKIILYTEDDFTPETTTVPDVIGHSLSDVNYLLTSANINFKAGDGATDRAGAVAASQNYEPGTIVEVGTVVEVTFMVRDEG